MRTLSVLAAGGALLLITVLPAAAQPVSPQATGAPVPLTAHWAFTVKKDGYVQRSRDEMREWQSKLTDAGETVSARESEASAAGMNGLRKAWARAEGESRKLELASADGWDRAMSSFEKASKNLKDAWQRIHPENE
jgi:hypothetical protein